MEGTEGREQAKEREDSLHFDLKVSTSFGLWNHSRVAEVTRALKIRPRDVRAMHLVSFTFYVRHTYSLCDRSDTSVQFFCRPLAVTEQKEKDKKDRASTPFIFAKCLTVA